MWYLRDGTPMKGELEDPCILMTEGLELLNRGKIRQAFGKWYKAVLTNFAVPARVMGMEEPEEQALEQEDRDEGWEYMNSTWFSMWSKNHNAFLALALVCSNPDIRWAVGLRVIERKKRKKREPLPDIDFVKMEKDYREILASTTPFSALWSIIIRRKLAHTNLIREMDKRGLEPSLSVLEQAARPLAQMDVMMCMLMMVLSAGEMGKEEIKSMLASLESSEERFQEDMKNLRAAFRAAGRSRPFQA